MASTVMSIATSVEAQSLNTIIVGFSFAAALAWFEVVKTLVAKVVKSGSGLQGSVITALLTTLLAVLVFLVFKTFVKNVEIKEPGAPIFAVTR